MVGAKIAGNEVHYFFRAFDSGRAEADSRFHGWYNAKRFRLYQPDKRKKYHKRNFPTFEAVLLPENDIELMLAFRRGAGHAYEAVYERFADGLCLFADKLVKDRLLAEDIAVEALAKSFRKHTDFETLDKLKSFLFTAANNAALDQLKIRKRHNRAHGEIRYLKEGEMDNAELAFIRTEAVQAVQDAINALPGQPRQVIRMVFLEGKKLPEIAAELNLSYNTVQNHRARGLEMMRIHLQKNKWLSSAGVWLALSLLERY